MVKKPRESVRKDMVKLDRRNALAKLGLAAGAAYAAPLVVPLDRSANAQVLPSPCVPTGKGKSKC